MRPHGVFHVMAGTEPGHDEEAGPYWIWMFASRTTLPHLTVSLAR